MKLLAMRLFLDPLPVWDIWPWLLLPLCLAVAVVYKCIKCKHVRQVPVEAVKLTLYILLAMTLTAAGVFGAVRLMEYFA